MTTFFASDLHFGHTNAVEKFTRDDGSPLRGFSTVEEMDETIIDNWNKTVSSNDRVFLLGDVVINKKYIHQAGRLNGKKTLVLGNHDIFALELYYPFFEKILPLKEFDGCVLTHIPVHPSQVGVGRRWRINVHGHLHDRHIIRLPIGFRDPDYYNVSIDCFAEGRHTGMNYFPKAWDEIKKESE
jgi:calcineurin-like phosphoesterase family protein